MFFSRFFRRNEMTEPAAEPARRVSPPEKKSGAPTTRAPGNAGEDALATSELFSEMEDIIGEEPNLIRIPSRALLAVLPEEHRGEAYRAEALPEDSYIELDRTDLLAQLRRGQVVYPLDALSAMLPEGWVKPDADLLVELSLPDVVEAVPAEFLRGADRLDEDIIHAAQMRDYFRPEPVSDAKPEAVPSFVSPPPAGQAPLPSAPGPVRTLPETPRPKAPRRPKPIPPAWAWNGVERGRDAGAHVIDLNHARREDLEKIPGLGRVRAERIVAWREKNGPFRSIYDLAEMPGMGRKLFQRATGLNPAVTKRKDRHALMNEWIGLAEEARPGLGLLLEHIRTALSLSVCILVDAQGVALASSPDSDDRSSLLAALTPTLFRRVRRTLTRITPGENHVLFLPAANNPLVFIRTGTYAMAAALTSQAPWEVTVGKFTRIGIEMEWMLGPRLVVYGPNPDLES